jgi:glycosyltransferase 2 family protein
MAKIEDAIVNEVDEEIHPKTLKAKLWEITKTLLKIAVTSVLLYFVFRKVHFEDVKNRLAHANYWWMLAALLSYFASMVVSSWRLLSFFKSISLKLDARFNFRLYLLGLFYNFLLPGGIGGDGYKIYLLNKTYKLPAKKVFWALMFDRLSGLWAIGFITVGLIFFIPQINIPITYTLGIFIAGTAAYFFVAYKFFNEYTKHFLAAHGKALLVQGLQLLTVVFVLMGQDFSGKFSPYLLSFLISALATVLPITMGGAGIRETVFTWMIKWFPEMDKSLSVFLPGSFFIISLIVAILGVYYVLRPTRLDEGLPKEEKVG